MTGRKKPNKHDILAGSRPDGTAYAGGPFPDMTCGDWTKGGTDGSAMVDHHDRAGPVDNEWTKSWNSAHPSLGCTQEALRKTGVDGLALLLWSEIAWAFNAQRLGNDWHKPSAI